MKKKKKKKKKNPQQKENIEVKFKYTIIKNENDKNDNYIRELEKQIKLRDSLIKELLFSNDILSHFEFSFKNEKNLISKTLIQIFFSFIFGIFIF